MLHVPLFVSAVIMASEYPKMSKQHTAGKIKHIYLAVPQIAHVIRKLESGEIQRQGMASYNIRSSTMI
jgi:hypothetical protein